MNIKWTMPTALTWVTWWALKVDVEEAYGGYPTWLHIFGLAFIVVAFVTIVVPGFFPYKGDTIIKGTKQKAKRNSVVNED